MRLDSNFYQLPVRFDAARLQDEAAQFAATDWLTHPTGFAGNSALILISVDGGINDDFAISGPMAGTLHLDRCPYIRQVLASFETPLSRCRLMRVAGGGNVPEHVDAEYHWFRRVRVHIPVRTDPSVRFSCDGETVHMAAGEAWIFDNSRPHRVENPVATSRVHLVFDTQGSRAFWDLVEASSVDRTTTLRPYQPGVDEELLLEPYSFEVLTAAEVNRLTADIEAAAREAPHGEPSVIRDLEAFRRDWATAFQTHGHSAAGELIYRQLIAGFETRLDGVELDERAHYAARIIRSMLKTTNRSVARRRKAPIRQQSRAVRPDARERYGVSPQVRLETSESGVELYPPGATAAISFPQRFVDVLESFRRPNTCREAFQAWSNPDEMSYDDFFEVVGKLYALRFLAADPLPPEFEQPLFIVSAPRAGGTLLFEALRRSAGLWTATEESDAWGGPVADRPGRGSDRLDGADADPRVAEHVLKSLSRTLADCRLNKYCDLPLRDRPGAIRFVGHDLRHGLRIPFLRALFPDARFVHVYREPCASIASIVAAWRSGKFVTSRALPGWLLGHWSLSLPPGWQALKPASLEEVAAFQWTATNRLILDDLEAVPAEARLLVRYADLVGSPESQIERVCRIAGAQRSDEISAPLPLSGATLSAPDTNKWRRHEDTIRRVLPVTEPVANRVRDRA